MDLETAINKLIDDYTGDDILKVFLIQNREDILDSLPFDDTFERRIELEKQDVERYRKELEVTKEELSEVNDKLSETNDKLSEANDKLSEAKMELSDLDKLIEDRRLEIARLKKKLRDAGLDDSDE